MTSPRVPEEDIASGRSPVVVVPDAIGAGDALPLSDADLVQLRLDLDAQLANLLPVQAVPASAAVPPAGSPNVASYVGKNSKAIPTVSRFDQVTLRGGRLTADVGSVVTDMTLSMSMDAVAQLTVTIIDKGYVKLGSGIFAGKPTMT